MGGSCSDLALSENPCLIGICVNTVEKVDKKLSWVLHLNPNTYYNGHLVTHVIGTIWASTPEAVQLLSVIKRCVEQSVCPFFSYIYAVGHNCSTERLTTVFHETLPNLRQLLDKAVPKQNRLLVLHEPSDNTDLQTWMQGPVPFIEKVLMLFQLTFSCYVLELAGLPYGVRFENLRVSKGEIERYALYGNTQFVSYFHFETAFKLQVVEYQLFLQNGNNTEVITSLIEQLFPGVLNTKNVELSVIFMRLARWLIKENIVSHNRVPKRLYNVYGVRGSFFINKNLPRFTVNHETKVAEVFDNMLTGLKEKKYTLVQRRLDLESQQKEIQEELQKFK